MKNAAETTTYDNAMGKRPFGDALRKAVPTWSGIETLCTQDSTSELFKTWHDRLTSIASQASFLGHARTIQICKVTFAALKKLQHDSKSIAMVEAKDGLQAALHMITQAVASPDAVNIADVDTLTKQLRSVFDLSENAVKEPLSLHDVSQLDSASSDTKDSIATSAGTANLDLDSKHRDESVYCKEIIHDLDYCADEESWIVSQLASIAEDLATGNSSDRPAHRLLAVLQGHRFFQRVDRVCLAGRVPYGNQLVIIDSANSDRVAKNMLRKGYSCFVNPNGSLFSMQPSTVRIFGECNRVLASFNQQSKPAQRSIALIAEQGMRSGLCIAIGRGTVLQGFLFLNSKEPGLFDSITARYAPLLSLFGLLGTISLDAFGFHAREGRPAWLVEDSIPMHAISFDKEQLSNWLSIHAKHWFDFEGQTTINSSSTLNNFLYLPGILVSMTCELISQLNWNPRLRQLGLSIAIQQKCETVSFSIKHHCDWGSSLDQSRVRKVIAQLNAHLQNKPLSCRADESHIHFEFPYEPTLTGQGGQLYSIVY